MVIRRRQSAQTIFSIALLSIATAFAAEETRPVEAEILPDPLTLQQAIAWSEKANPDLEIAEGLLRQRQGDVARVRSDSGVKLNLYGAAQSVDPVVGGNGTVDDSLATALLSKSLYDFGKSGNRVASVRASLEGEWARFFDARQKNRLEVMALFYDVLLADLRYRVDDETMARTYVQYDRIRQRHGLGQVSDVVLMEWESAYRQALSERVRSQSMQRATRAKLAIAMNRPDQLADNLAAPILDSLNEKIPEYSEILNNIIETNPQVRAAKQQVLAAEKRLAAARATRRPELSAELEASAFERRMGMRNDSRASLVLKWPLYQGGLRNAELMKAEGELRVERARKTKAENAIRQRTLEILQRIEHLQYRLKETSTLVNYRDLKLDESRAYYEMEARTTLGDAMIGVTDAQWQAAKVRYELALAWAQLKALSGELVEKTPEEKFR
jgi:outer membrane protein TolC